MKYALIGDVHGTELRDLESALHYENPDVLICTGDFDQTRTIHQFIELERNYERAGKSVIKVPGNHDHAILNNFDISSGALRKQGKTSRELHNELMSDNAAYHYIDGLVNSKDPRCTNNRVKIFLDENRFGKEYKTVIVHGAYDGDLSSFPDCPSRIRDLWLRLRTPEDHADNFRAMAEKGYKVMVRGHDHEAVYAYNDPIKGVVIRKPKENASSFRLLRHRQHTINPGALFNGRFAIIDTRFKDEKVPILRYHSL